MDDKIFIPFSEELFGKLINSAAASPLGELVPYQLEYRCVRLLDGTYEFTFDSPDPQPTLQTESQIVHAA